jgi:hypothetical protein
VKPCVQTLVPPKNKMKIIFGGFFAVSQMENLKCRGEVIAKEISEAMKVKAKNIFASNIRVCFSLF